MNIRLMGTGGADGIPALFGSDRVSTYAREHGGREIRSRAGALIDGTLKIDLPPDTWSQCAAQGIDATEWTALLFTHSDDDHLAVNELQYALYPFTEADHSPMAIYGNAAVLDRIHARFPDWPIELHLTEAFASFDIHGHLVTPILARHGSMGPGAERCHNLLVERNGTTLLYATDTGEYTTETLDFLAAWARTGRAIDLLVIECTDARAPSGYAGHLDLVSLESTLSRLRRGSVLGPECRVVTTHHSSRGDATHGELLDLLEPLGAEPGYDGQVLTL